MEETRWPLGTPHPPKVHEPSGAHGTLAVLCPREEPWEQWVSDYKCIQIPWEL